MNTETESERVPLAVAHWGRKSCPLWDEAQIEQARKLKLLVKRWNAEQPVDPKDPEGPKRVYVMPSAERLLVMDGAPGAKTD